MEYGILLNVSIASTLGIAGGLAVMVVSLAIVATLYMIGYVMYSEHQRKDRGY